jgi:hypothetical protein
LQSAANFTANATASSVAGGLIVLNLFGSTQIASGAQSNAVAPATSARQTDEDREA